MPGARRSTLMGSGWQVEWEHRFTPQLPVFLCSKRDEMEILLTEHTGDCPVGGLVHLDVPDRRCVGMPSSRSRGFQSRSRPTRACRGCAT